MTRTTRTNTDEPATRDFQRASVTGEDVQAKFDAWRDERERRRSARAAEDTARGSRHGLVVVMAAAIIVVVAVSAVTGDRFGASRAAGEARIQSLTSELDATQALPSVADVSDRLVALDRATARDAAAVRDAQQGYAALYRAASTQGSPGNGSPSPAMRAMAEHARVLAPLFTAESWIANDDQAYSWHDVPPYDASEQIDPRFAWYVRYDGPRAADPGQYTWQVETVTPDPDSKDVTGKPNQAHVVWLCRDTASGEVLVWSSALYTYEASADTGQFSDLDVVTTAAGAKYTAPVHEVASTVKKPATATHRASAKDQKKSERKDKKR